MDSIELLKTTVGHYGKQCRVTVTTGDEYVGIYHGYAESTKENPLVLRLGVSSSEAERIGVPYLKEIGVSYEVITAITF